MSTGPGKADRCDERRQFERFRAVPGAWGPRNMQHLVSRPFFGPATSRRIAPINFRMGETWICIKGLPKERHDSVPAVRPGGEIYQSPSSWPKVRAAVDLIDAIVVAGVGPCDLSRHAWRHMRSRLTIGRVVRPHGSERHAPYLRRKALGL